MIEPYESVISSLSPKLLRLGLAKIGETEDGVVFSDGLRTLDISTEVRNPAQIIIAVTDTHGLKRALWLLENLIDFDATQAKVARARIFWEEHRFDSTPVPQLLRDGSLLEFIETNLNWTVDFIAKHFEAVFDPPEELQTKYLEAAKRR